MNDNIGPGDQHELDFDNDLDDHIEDQDTDDMADAISDEIFETVDRDFVDLYDERWDT